MEQPKSGGKTLLLLSVRFPEGAGRIFGLRSVLKARAPHWNARARAKVAKGARVRVVGVHDLMLDVEEIR